MAIPERRPRSDSGPETSNTASTPSDEDKTFEPIGLDEQLEAEFDEDYSDDDLVKGGTSFESELVGNATTSSRIKEDPEDSPSKEDGDPVIKPGPMRTNRDGKASALPRQKKKKLGKQPVEIDPKSKKLLPFGGTKKKTLRVNNLEPRRNLRREQTIARYAVLGLAAIVAVAAVKTAVFPPESLSKTEVAQIAQQTTGFSNFPVESGRGFATDFMRAYLTIDPNSPSSDVLNYYYTGAMESKSSGSSSSSKSNRTATGSYNQNIIYGPTVYSARGITDNSGSYTIGALVQPKTVTNNGSGETTDADPQWMFFNVNVYYDDASQSFAITPESPSVIPATQVKSPDEIPAPAPLGTGKASDELKDDTSSTVNGFIQGYMTSTPADHSALDQYIVSNPDASLRKGLGGKYQLSKSSNAIDYEAFPVEDTNEVKVRVNVMWVASPDGSAKSESRAQFTSTYIMTLERQGDGRYLVSKFAPEYYVSDPTKK